MIRYRIIPSALRERRKAKGFSQGKLARMIGVYARTVDEWETGADEGIRQINLARLCRALDVPLREHPEGGFDCCLITREGGSAPCFIARNAPNPPWGGQNKTGDLSAARAVRCWYRGAGLDSNGNPVRGGV